MTANDFEVPGAVVQLGYAPKRIDLITSIDGVAFDDCWAARMEIDVGGLLAPFIDLPNLVANKRASGRPQDMADVAALVEGGGMPGRRATPDVDEQ